MSSRPTGSLPCMLPTSLTCGTPITGDPGARILSTHNSLSKKTNDNNNNNNNNRWIRLCM